MGKLSKEKGKRGEREFAAFLSSHGFKAIRGQQYRGGPDSPDVMCSALPFHIEVKRAERLSIYKAMDKVTSEAPPGKIPLIAHRQNGKRWLCILDAADLLKLTQSRRTANALS